MNMPSLLRSLLFKISFAFFAFFVATHSAPAATFPIPYNTETGTIPFLQPNEALARLKMPEAFHATIFASEPKINQPIQLTTDARGRIWVCENNTYAERARNFDTNLHDRILILEDTGHDNVADKFTVFSDSMIRLTAVFPGFGGVFALCPPQLLFIPDRDGNDVPDGEPQVLLDGFDAGPVRHNIANGLKLGPDGWLYGRHGILATSHVGAPGTPAAERVDVNAGIWRFHPVTHKFEVVCQGTTNPWGDDWDENGQHFFINTVIGHLWHVIPGAYYKRMYGEHPNPYLYELIDQTADHVHWDTAEKWSDIRDLGVTGSTSARGGGHAHSGFLIYQGDNWPAQYRNTALTINYHGQRLNNDRLARAGATYTATHLPDPIQFGDPWFRGVELITGPDGAVYVADWSDIGECHDDTGVHRTSGRIYKIWYGELKPGSTEKPEKSWDLREEKSVVLADIFFEAHDFFWKSAKQILQERAAAGTNMSNVHRAFLEKFDRHPDPEGKLRAVWGIHAIGKFDEAFGSKLLGHTNEFIRTAAVQLLSDEFPNSTALTRLARSEQSGLVLTFLAAAMRKCKPDQRFEIARSLIQHAEFAGDRVFPLMVWYAIQPDITQNIPNAITLAEKSELPKIRRFITRRIFEDLAKNPAAAEQITGLLLGARSADFHLDILGGMHDALKGVRSAKAPANWKKVTELLQYSSHSEVHSLAEALSAIFGDASAIRALRITALDDPHGHALETLIQIRAQNLSPILKSALEKPELTATALRAFAMQDDAEAPKTILAHYNNLTATNKAEAINTLATRPNFALALLEAIQRGQIKKQDITATHLRQLRSLSDKTVTEKINTLWPQLDTTPNAKKQLFEKYKTLLTQKQGAPALAGSPSAGRATFQQLCATCHTLFGEGAKIGPDLTGSDRKNLDYLLDNIINPSAVVPETYRVTNLELKDGRSLTGIILTQTDGALTLQTTSEKLTLPKTDIAEQQTSQLSMMPDGLLETLSEKQIIDLFAYLQSDGK
jgi:putative membrane-bound dehydrogenase-like protein